MAVLVYFVLILSLVGHSSATYCLCKDGLSDGVMQKAIDYACGAGADCTQISQNGGCYNPNTVKDHCNYAVNSYFQKKGQAQGSCDFSGTAAPSQTVPQQASSTCVYPTGSSTTTTPSTTPPSTTTPSTTPPSTTTPSTTPPSTTTPSTTTPSVTPPSTTTPSTTTPSTTTPSTTTPSTTTPSTTNPSTTTPSTTTPSTTTPIFNTPTGLGPTGSGTTFGDSSDGHKTNNLFYSIAMAMCFSTLMLLY